MGVSPTKTGEMREDQFWLLKSNVSWTYYDKINDSAVEPVAAHEVDLVRGRCSRDKLPTFTKQELMRLNVDVGCVHECSSSAKTGPCLGFQNLRKEGE